MRVGAILALAILLAACQMNQTKSAAVAATPGEVLASLRDNPEAELSEKEGWTVAVLPNETGRTVWSFPPEEHEAYPAMVKQTVVVENGSEFAETSAQCSGSQSVCNALLGEFHRTIAD